MADIMAAAATWLAGKLKAKASTSVTYRRGASSVAILATMGRKLLRTSDRQGNTKVERADKDFVFTTADLNFGAGVVEPVAGDFIDVVEGAVTTRYQVCPLNSEPAFTYCDGANINVRVHTKYYGTA